MVGLGLIFGGVRTRDRWKGAWRIQLHRTSLGLRVDKFESEKQSFTNAFKENYAPGILLPYRRTELIIGMVKRRHLCCLKETNIKHSGFKMKIEL